MMQPDPEVWKHVQRMLANIKGLFDAADFDAEQLPEWGSPPLGEAYTHLEAMIACVQQHQELTRDVVAKK
jgi:hypothetical protein